MIIPVYNAPVHLILIVLLFKFAHFTLQAATAMNTLSVDYASNSMIRSILQINPLDERR